MSFLGKLLLIFILCVSFLRSLHAETVELVHVFGYGYKDILGEANGDLYFRAGPFYDSVLYSFNRETEQVTYVNELGIAGKEFDSVLLSNENIYLIVNDPRFENDRLTGFELYKVPIASPQQPLSLIDNSHSDITFSGSENNKLYYYKYEHRFQGLLSYEDSMEQGQIEIDFTPVNKSLELPIKNLSNVLFNGRWTLFKGTDGYGNSYGYFYDRVTNNAQRLDIFNPATFYLLGDSIYTTGFEFVFNGKLGILAKLYKITLPNESIETEVIAEDILAHEEFPNSVVYQSALYFTASLDPSVGHELYKFDPVTKQIDLVADINAGIKDSDINNMIVFDDKLYFVASSADTSQELFAYNAATGQTRLAAIINTTDKKEYANGPSGSTPKTLTVYQGKLYFSAFNGDTGRGLYRLSANTAPDIVTTFKPEAKEMVNVSVDASATTDVENDELTFFWQQSAGTPVELSDPTNSVVSFIAPDITQDEIITFELTVNDGLDQSSESIDILIKHVNQAPSISITMLNEFYEEGELISIAFQSFDPDDDELSYSIQQIAGIQLNLNEVDGSPLNLQLPLVNKNEQVELLLTVSDGDATESVNIQFTIVDKLEEHNTSSNNNGGSTYWLLIILCVMLLNRRVFVHIADNHENSL